jgi:hypothetical protein
MFIGSTSPFGAKLIWETRAPAKVSFFFLVGSTPSLLDRGAADATWA